MSTTISYGGTNLVPAPMISISKNYDRTSAGIAIGTTFDIELNGVIIAGTSGANAGLSALMSGVRDIRNIFNADGKRFEITCNNQVLWECYPTIISPIHFEQSSDHWVNTIPFSVTLRCNQEPVDDDISGSGENTNLMPPYIQDFQEDWQYEFSQDTSVYSIETSSGTDTNFSPSIRATHTISAKGKSQWNGPGLTGNLVKPAWVYAKDYVEVKLESGPSVVTVLESGLFNTVGTTYQPYNHFRTQRIDEAGGTFGITETFVLNNANNNHVIEDFDISVESSIEDPLTTISIQGVVRGLELTFYGTNETDFEVTGTKFNHASGYFETIKDTALIFPRAQAIANSVSLNNTPVTKIVGYSPTQGEVTYSYVYNNRPSNCITGAINETIQINDENPSDVFTSIVVMGRAQGPILQSFNTVTEFRRNVSFDVLMAPNTGCSISALTGGNNPNNQVVTILCAFENDLRNRYSRVLKERDSTFWEPRFGRYNRNVTWVAVNCDTAPAISLCSGA